MCIHIYIGEICGGAQGRSRGDIVPMPHVKMSPPSESAIVWKEPHTMSCRCLRLSEGTGVGTNRLTSSAVPSLPFHPEPHSSTSCRRDVAEMQGRYRGDTREIQGR